MPKPQHKCRICREPIPSGSKDELVEKGYSFFEITSQAWDQEEKRFYKTVVEKLSFCPNHSTEEILRRVTPLMGIPRSPSRERMWKVEL